MGFTTMLDIIGASIIGGILLMTLFRIQDNAINNFYYYNSEAILQNQLLEIIDGVETDLHRIGYCSIPENFPDPTLAIIDVGKSTITFLCDVNLNGKMDTIKYYLGPVSELNNTNNPNDRILYRSVNSKLFPGYGVGFVTQFDLKYFNSLGQELTLPIKDIPSITTIQVSILVESPDAYSQNYANAYWRQVRLASRNLTSR